MVTVANTYHVMQRIAERVPDPVERDRLFRDMLRHAATLSGQGIHDVAVRFARVGFHGVKPVDTRPGMVQDTGSNGDCATFIMRGDVIITFMWRRATQPHMPEKYTGKNGERVNHTRCVKSACTGIREGYHVHA